MVRFTHYSISQQANEQYIPAYYNLVKDGVVVGRGCVSVPARQKDVLAFITSKAGVSLEQISVTKIGDYNVR